MKNKKHAFIGCNEKFLEVITLSFTGGLPEDPLGEHIYLEPLADCRTIGESLLKAMAKSRDLSISEEDRQALIEGRVTDEWIDEKYPEQAMFDPVPCAERYKEWVKEVMKTYKYKTKKALMQNMQHVSVEDDGDLITFSSSHHLTIDGWGDPDGKTPSIEFSISSKGSAEVVGAAVMYAIGNCRGLGADFMRELLFPDGQPETFDEYLKKLDLKTL